MKQKISTHCGNGQMSDGQTRLKENLSFCVERGVHHHGNHRSGLVNSIPFVKKRTHSHPPPRKKSINPNVNAASAWQIVDFFTPNQQQN